MTTQQTNKNVDPAIEWLNHHNKTGCPHSWNYIGHGHNSSYYQCSKCGVKDDY